MPGGGAAKRGAGATAPTGGTPLGFAVRCSDLATLMGTGKAEEGDKTLAPSDKTAIRHLRELGGVEGLADKIGSDVTKGIDSSTLKERQRVYGPNEIAHERAKTYLELCWAAAHDSTLIMLEMAATVSLVLETATADEDKLETAWIEGVAIYCTVLIVINVTAFNDYQKEKQFRALKAKADEGKVVAVIRDGEPLSKDVKPDQVVVGDVVEVKSGDVLGADGVLIEGLNVTVDESAMSGESKPRVKDPVDVPWMFAGTSIQTGQGKMLVTAVGINSAEGVINSLVTGEGDEEKARQRAVEGDLDLPRLFADQKEMEPSENAVVGAGRRNKQKGQRDSVLALKLEKLAWSLGAVAAVVAAMCLLGLLVRLLVTTYSDCDGCSNDGWGIHKWGEVVSFIITAITVLVVAIPEGLPLAVTISLAYSVRKMQKDMCLVRVLASCETMGNAQCICSDKTGTLTQNKMSVQVVYIGEKLYGDSKQMRCDAPFADLKKLPIEMVFSIVEDAALNSSHKTLYVPKLGARTGAGSDPKNMSMEERIAQSRDFVAADISEIEQVGSKTECAILLLGDYFHPVTSMGYVQARRTYGAPPMQYDFNRATKRASTVICRPESSTVFPPGSHRVYVNGAPQYLLPLCTSVATADGSKPLTAEAKTKIEESVINEFAFQAFRVLLLAYRDVPSDMDFHDEDGLVRDLTLLCITGIMDPPRPEVIDAIQACHGAGVTVRMVTGDAKETATAIAVKIGLCTEEEAKEEGTVWVGKDFSAAVYDEATDTLDYAELSRIWPKLKVMGRCEPRDKYNLVCGLIHDGEVVAVTGDGTNDAPALAKADVGFSMGLAGTDVAKAASDIVLLDDNFASIVKAISWGRNVYDSISKFLVFQLTVTFTSVVIEFIGSIAIGTAPLRATQLIWVNLIMDTFASLALATEVPVPELLHRKPNKRDDPLLTKHMAKQILGHGIYQLTVSFLLLYNAHKWFDVEDGTTKEYDDPPTKHFTLVFNTFVWMTLFNQLNARRIDGNLNVFRGLGTNPMFLMIMSIEVLGQAIVVEFGGYAFRTRPQTGAMWGTAIAFGFGSLLWNVVIHVLLKDDWIPQWFINIFKVSLAGTGADVAAAEEPEEREAEPSSCRCFGGGGPAQDDEGGGYRLRRSDSSLSQMSESFENIGRFFAASKRVKLGMEAVKAFEEVVAERRLLEEGMLERARALQERHGLLEEGGGAGGAVAIGGDASGGGGEAGTAPSRQDSSDGARELWRVTLDAVRRQALPVAELREGLNRRNAVRRHSPSNGGGNGAEAEAGAGAADAPPAAEGDDDSYIDVGRTESYNAAVSS